ncbi:hypothetical protein Acr_23g0011550 [Actinidia rufa]|uniref:Retrotransposon gag domain-containing protein n=1 Tax=Actinidia rufa TaxID=165716 RepID=A0A7J0GPM7_9ERIC|nr:hypothetical protein Acr_23g0011550 [Actinidia rufa]
MSENSSENQPTNTEGKLSHLMGTGPAAAEDATFAKWDEEDSMIMSWLWNSMTPEVSRTCMFLTTAREVWETIRQTYSKMQDAALIYEIRTKLNTTKQGNLSATEYYSTMKGLWLELDYYQNFKMKCGEDAAMLQKFVERERIFEFLAGLNIDFDQVQVQVLGKESLISLEGVFSIIRAEESRRGVMLDNLVNERSAMNSTKLGHTAETNRNERQPNREGVWCTYCKKPRHTKDTCWKLHGKPPNVGGKGGNPGVQPRGQAHMTNAEDVHSEKINQDELETLKEEIEKLKSMLNSGGKPGNSCSLIQSGKYSNSYALSASFPAQNSTWIMDSSATDHMVFHISFFLHISLVPAIKKSELPMEIVLLLQDRVSGKMIGLAKERDGLYIFDAKEGKPTVQPKNQDQPAAVKQPLNQDQHAPKSSLDQSCDQPCEPALKSSFDQPHDQPLDPSKSAPNIPLVAEKPILVYSRRKEPVSTQLQVQDSTLEPGSHINIVAFLLN